MGSFSFERAHQFGRPLIAGGLAGHDHQRERRHRFVRADPDAVFEAKIASMTS